MWNQYQVEMHVQDLLSQIESYLTSSGLVENHDGQNLTPSQKIMSRQSMQRLNVKIQAEDNEYGTSNLQMRSMEQTVLSDATLKNNSKGLND